MTQPESLAALPSSIYQGLKSEDKLSMKVRLLRSGVIGVVCACAVAFQIVSAQSTHPNSRVADVRQVQQQYQKLVQDLYGEEAKIQENRANYGRKSIDDIRDTIENLVGTIKKTPPSEDPGEGLSHYVEFLMKAKDLVNTAFKTLDGIADSKDSLAAKDLRLQKLNQDFARANSALQAVTSISRAAGNPSVKLHELPNPDKDWAALDQAIEQMRREDLPSTSTLNEKPRQLRNRQESAPYASLPPTPKAHVATSEPKSMPGAASTQGLKMSSPASPSQAKPIGAYSCVSCPPVFGAPAPATGSASSGNVGTNPNESIQAIDDALRQPRPVSLSPIPEVDSSSLPDGGPSSQPVSAPDPSLRSGGSSRTPVPATGTSVVGGKVNPTSETSELDPLAKALNQNTDIEYGPGNPYAQDAKIPESTTGEGPALPKANSISVLPTGGNATSSTPSNAAGSDPRGGVNVGLRQGYQVDDDLTKLIQDSVSKAAEPRDQKAVGPEDGKATKTATKKP